MKKQSTKKLVLTALLGAMSALLMVFEFSVPLAPTFVKFDFSDLPIIIGGFLMGPLSGIATAIIKILLSTMIRGTTTMFVGELSNLILSIVFVFPASYLYQHHKTKTSAKKGLISGTIIASMLAIISNLFVIFPLYASLFGISLQDILKMAMVTNPLVTNMTTMMIFSLLPFNLLKYGVISVVTIVVYKKLSLEFKKYI
ncbi:ECF transporter S component [Candidatus Stoquefichus massiliensis]|uniref:ECF transporter S component n=1 Tax=Candidatus Stoquefichus massiliensis TaxID=1470350 RepID=UPI0004B9B88B|nr:ECF transporter S component [Candidatus Stoquefichus massiliensis]